MALTKRKTTVLTISVLVLTLLGLRVYGAYQKERDDALDRASIADQKAKDLNEKSEKLKRQSDCNSLWIKYENARLEKRIAELEGRIARVAIEPSCSGHATRLDELSEGFSRQMQLIFGALEASEYAKYERLYASNRQYQTRYLLRRVWGFMTGNEPKLKQAEMVLEIEKRTQLEKCLRAAKDDTQRKNCNSAIGKADNP